MNISSISIVPRFLDESASPEDANPASTLAECASALHGRSDLPNPAFELELSQKYTMFLDC